MSKAVGAINIKLRLKISNVTINRKISKNLKMFFFELL